MVGTLARLQLKLAWRGLSASTGRLIGTILLGLWGLSMAVGAFIGFVLLRSADADELRGPLLVLIFAALTLGWPVVTLFTAGSNENLTPGKFALFPVTARQLMPGLLAAALLGGGALITSVLGLGGVVAWSGSLGTALGALLAMALGVTTCVVSARAMTTLMSRMLESRRFRDLGAVVVFLVIMAATFVIQVVSRSLDVTGSGLERAGRIAAWTPFGWAWALPWDIARGQWLGLALHLIGGLALLGLWLWLWRRSLERALTTPLESTATAGAVKANRLDGLLPAGPAGAVARRELRYWRRDPRRLVQLLAFLVVPFFLIVPGITQQMAHGSNYVADFAALTGSIMLPSALAWSISYDGSALWMQVQAGVSGLDDRLGRSWALTIISVPVLLVILLLSFTLTGDWHLLPGFAGATLCGVLTSLGIGSFVGAHWQQAMPPPSGNVFARGSGTTSENMLGSMIATWGPLLLAAPSGILAVLAAWHPWMTWLSLGLGTLIGIPVSALGVWLGARRLDTHWPEVLAKVKEKNV